MSDDSRSFEKKLDRDFLIYLNLLKELFSNIKDATERNMCEVWLNQLVGKTANCTEEKCNRNVYLSRLLLQMQAGKLKGVFLDSPPVGELPCAFTTFGLPSEVDGLKGFEELGFQVDTTFVGAGGDFFETSRDGRTYLATKHLPQGMMAFIAVTNNEGDPIWIPQLDPVGEVSVRLSEPSSMSWSNTGFIKGLAAYVENPIYRARRSPEEREQVLQWFDQMITDCNKWIQGEDPHNAELENLFEKLYNDYKCDPQQAEILEHPRKVRTILMKEIRDTLEERREEVSNRQLILDQCEGEEYVEMFRLQRDSNFDDLWFQAASRPMSQLVTQVLYETYPEEVVQRFYELLYQERIDMIGRAEVSVNRYLNDVKEGIVDMLVKELSHLKRVQNEYNDWYCVYKDIEQRAAEFQKQLKEKCAPKQREDPANVEKMKRQIEIELEEAKRKYEKVKKTQTELSAKLDETKDNLAKMQEQMQQEEERFNCEKNKVKIQKEELQKIIRQQKKKTEDLKCIAAQKRNTRQ